MAISDQERTYFNKAIDILFTNRVKYIRAGKCLDKDLLADVMSCLEGLRSGFVAAASAAGVVTLDTISALTTSDITTLRSYSGYTEADAIVVSSDGGSLKNNFAALEEISGNKKYEITGIPRNVTACGFVGDTDVIELTDVIAYGSTDLLGIFKAYFDCNSWARNSSYEDHWYTQTDNVADCQGPTLPEFAWGECLEALNITIIKV